MDDQAIRIGGGPATPLIAPIGEDGLARVVVAGLPQHVTQRGNRRETVFFEDDDYAAYLALISGAATRSGTRIWSYCLMANHGHFVVTPSNEDGLGITGTVN